MCSKIRVLDIMISTFQINIYYKFLKKLGLKEKEIELIFGKIEEEIKRLERTGLI